MKTILTADVSDKTVLVRGDLDVAMEDGKVVEDYRLEALVPTINYLKDKHAKIVLIGHLGRPEGVDPAFSLKPVIARVSELISEDIPFIENWLDDKEAVTNALRDTSIVALENLRFDQREKDNDKDFAQALASLVDVFVNESFATAHREQASTIAVTEFLPSYAGLRFQQEIEELSKVRENPYRPLVMVMGGGKAETKVPLVSGISSFADHILLGGKLMFATELEGVKGARFPVDSVRVDDIGPKSVELFGEY
ncbi:phosphoglycerate kinase, partial [candidate division WWE3 bacterium]|nr:phosphoglycerate kinase [candidate division WWE3 bacterium]